MSIENNPALRRFIVNMMDAGVTDEGELLEACGQFLAVQRALPTTMAAMN